MKRTGADGSMVYGYFRIWIIFVVPVMEDQEVYLSYINHTKNLLKKSDYLIYNINQRAIAASLGHTQFETYTDEHRKEYVIADNSLNEDIYERGIETNVGDLMYGATKEAKGLLDLAEAEETFAQAGEKCVQNAIITTVQYIYKFGCEVGIY